MISINLSLAGLDVLITGLKNKTEQLHQKAVDNYPESGYESLDLQSVESNDIVNFLLLSKTIKELELGYNKTELDIAYLDKRLLQLEKFLYKDVASHHNDLLNVMAGISRNLTEKKYQQHLLRHKVFPLEMPELFADQLEQHGFLYKHGPDC